MSKCCTHVLTFRSIIPPGKSNYSLLQFVWTSFNTGYFWPHFFPPPTLQPLTAGSEWLGVRVAGGEGQRMFTAALSISDQDRDGKTIDKTMSYLKMGRRRYFWKWWGGPRRRGWTRGNKGVVSCSAVFRLSYLGMSSNPISRKSKIQILNSHCVRFNKKTHYKKHHIFIPLVIKLSLSELLWTHGSAIWLPIYSLQK